MRGALRGKSYDEQQAMLAPPARRGAVAKQARVPGRDRERGKAQGEGQGESEGRWRPLQSPVVVTEEDVVRNDRRRAVYSAAFSTELWDAMGLPAGQVQRMLEEGADALAVDDLIELGHRDLSMGHGANAWLQPLGPGRFPRATRGEDLSVRLYNSRILALSAIRSFEPGNAALAARLTQLNFEHDRLVRELAGD